MPTFDQFYEGEAVLKYDDHRIVVLLKVVEISTLEERVLARTEDNKGKVCVCKHVFFFMAVYVNKGQVIFAYIENTEERSSVSIFMFQGNTEF